ncbi:MAG: DUF3604 domain-containing protein [Alphaproteobacteria bacterium]|nr:DUF3604 domain-containing protein [Alphaproteobacteria bacterium]
MSGLAIPIDTSGTAGSAVLDGPSPVVAGMAGTWTATFRAGPAGLPAGSALAFVRRWPSDWDVPQCHSPDQPGFTTISISPPCRHRWRTRRSIEWHPFDHVFQIDLLDALPPGAAVAARFGLRAQTFIEEASPLSVRVRAGADATRWTEIAQLTVAVVGAPAHRGLLVAPSDVVAGAPFELSYRLEDAWGNPAAPTAPPVIEGAATVPLPDRPGVMRWTARIDAVGDVRLVARGALGTVSSNPIRVHAAEPERRLHWGDIHAQCVIGCGARTIDAFFRHAREFSQLDFASHQANCFLVSTPEWRETEEVTARHNRPGAFVTLLGLEWSADTAKGGDRNLYFPGDTAPITRCSHEYVDDKSDLASDLPQAEDLHARYRGTRTLIALHVGGRTTDLRRHDPTLERLIEVHSTHATSEWFLFEALERGYRMGVTAGSDGVDGRPGASHPGHQAVRNVRGGLVAAPLKSLTREGLWEALRARNCYATTGERIRLEFTAEGRPMGSEFDAAHPPSLSFAIEATAPLEAIDIFRGTTVIHSVALRPDDAPLSDRVRIAWRGATAPGNFSRARMRWDGSASLSSGRFDDVAAYAFDTPDEGIVATSERRIEWRSMTGGDWDGVMARIEAPDDAILTVQTPQISATVPVGSLATRPTRIHDDVPRRELEIRRLPRDPGPLAWAGAFRDPQGLPGWNAYWVRVRQWDGALAWSSPIFVRLPGTAAP